MMSNSINKLIILSLVTLLILPSMMVTGCSPSDIAKVRIGYLLGDLHHLPLFVAIEKGFFQEEGIDVEVVGPFDAGPAEMDAMAAGHLDIGYVGASPAIMSAARGVPLAIISGVNQEGSALVADKGITSIGDLRSKKIATPAPGSIQHIMTGMVLSENNLSFKDVELFPGTIKAPDMPLNLQSGRISAYFIWEPFVAMSVVSGSGHVLVNSKDIWPGHPCCVVVTRDEFLKNNDREVKAVVSAHQKAVKFIVDNPAESKRIGQKYTGLGADVIDSAFSRVKYVTGINNNDLVKFVNGIIELGENGSIKPIITRKEVPEADDFINGIIDLKYLSR